MLAMAHLIKIIAPVMYQHCVKVLRECAEQGNTDAGHTEAQEIVDILHARVRPLAQHALWGAAAADELGCVRADVGTGYDDQNKTDMLLRVLIQTPGVFSARHAPLV